MVQRIENDRTIAALLLVGSISLAIAYPQLATFFAPLMLPSLFFIILFSLLPFATQKEGSIFELAPSTILLVMWKQFALPAIVLLVCQFLEVSAQLTLFAMVTVTAGTLFASPTIVQLLNLDSKVAVQSVIMSTIAAPVAIYVFVAPLLSGAGKLDLIVYLERVGLFLVLPLILFFFLRNLISRQSDARKEQISSYSRWGAVVALMIFGCAIMKQVSAALDSDPDKVWTFLALATVVSVGAGIATLLVFSRAGRRRAYTGSVLTGFRNVGLSFAMLGASADPDLALYVGVSQIPVFVVPLLLDVFLDKQRQSHEAQAREQSSWDNLRMALANVNPAAGDHPTVASGSDHPSAVRGTVATQSDIPSNLVTASVGEHYPAVQRPSSAGGMVVGNTALAVDPYEVGKAEVAEEPEHAIHLIQRLQQEHNAAREEAERLSQAKEADRSFSAYAIMVLVFGALVVGAVWEGNRYFAPMLYSDPTLQDVAEAHTKGRNYGVYDLNINIRDLRNETIKRMAKAPEVVVLGASHWQEAHTSLMPYKDFYNSHVHRDYYEDMPAMVEMYARHNKMPKEMIITIRDNLFTPIKDRTDFLWLPGIKYYRAMAKRMGMKPHSSWETMPVQTWRELLSLKFLWENALRDVTAPMKPHASDLDHFKNLDVLLPGGSILWSQEHRDVFTPERAARESLAFAAQKRVSPPKIDPEGVRTIDTLLSWLKERGVKVTLAHPPFNPIYWDAVSGSPYMTGLKEIEELTKRLAEKHDLKIISSFNPHDVGCKAHMYIDAEHSSPECLGKVLDQYSRLFGPVMRSSMAPGETSPPAAPALPFRESLTGVRN
ncbi:MAG: hypothetical protein AAF468_16685 [Pseudomonadota bacterium]